MPISQSPTSPTAPNLDSCWQEFNRLFPSEDACVEHLRRLLRVRSKCSTCANKLARTAYGARSFKCQFCFKKCWLTAGTFFHRVRQVRPWLAAIFLFERGISFNAVQFQRLLGIAHSTASTILKKITVAAHSAMQENATEEVPSSVFRPVFTKRSRETPARELPVAEQEAIDRSAGVTVSQMQLSQLSTQDPVEKAIYECLSFEPLPYDAICEKAGASVGQVSAALTFMELSGLVTRLHGDRYVWSAPVSAFTADKQLLDEPQKKVVDRILEYMRSKFGGISRKYLQNYISMHWCQIDRKRKSKRSVLDLCLGHKSVSYKEIREYVSPPLVQIAAIEI